MAGLEFEFKYLFIQTCISKHRTYAPVKSKDFLPKFLYPNSSFFFFSFKKFRFYVYNILQQNILSFWCITWPTSTFPLRLCRGSAPCAEGQPPSAEWAILPATTQVWIHFSAPLIASAVYAYGSGLWFRLGDGVLYACVDPVSSAISGIECL